MIKINFRRPIIILTPKDEGYERWGIIIYSRHELLMETRIVSPEYAKQKGHVASFDRYVVCVQYKYYLEIDLWICVLRFNWLGKNRSKKYDGI